MLVGLIGALIGVPFILFWYFLRRRGARSLSWPSVSGRVVESKLVFFKDSDGNSSPEAQLRYTYDVAGAVLSGSTVAIAGGGQPAKTIEKYPVGTAVQVFYDPNKPSSAVLVPGGKGLNSLLVVGIALIVLTTGFGIARSFMTGHPAPPTESYSQAVGLYSAGKFDQAEPEFQTLARGGREDAKVYLGVMYAKGQGVKQDFLEAQKWFILAGGSGKNNRAEIRKGLTVAQEQEAEHRAVSWEAAGVR